jgi:hypothetical protein
VNWLRAAALAGALLSIAAPVYAQVNAREPDPAVWLRQVYDLYHRAEHSAALEKQANTDLVVKRSSKALGALFKKDNDCVAKGDGVCALDWDFVIDGQDWRISNVNVGSPVIDGDKATVTVTFKNFKESCINVYSFVRENGAWKVGEIETKSGKDAPLKIGKLLKDYDYSQ